MEEIWMTACRNLEISDDVARPWYERIRHKMVQGSGRFYHNWDELLLRKEDYLRDVSATIVLAVFFQYYEFDGKRNCVEKNCEAFEEFCSQAGIKDETTIKLVKKLLGDESIDAVPGGDGDANLLQDLDLLVLGSPLEEYKRYRELLRKEYSNLDDASYKQMRLKKSSDEVPSTSRRAALSTRNTYTPSSSNVKRSPRKRVPFKKFKDDRYKEKFRDGRITKGKPLLKKIAFSNLAVSPSQIVSRKILKSIKKKKSPLSKPNTRQTTAFNESLKISLRNPFAQRSPVRSVDSKPKVKSQTNGEMKKTTVVSPNPVHIPATTSKAEDLDDDCICVDPKPEVILIDDETLVSTEQPVKESLSQRLLKLYEPIGNMRTANYSPSKMTTSTPRDNDLSGLKFFGDTTPMDVTLIPKRVFSYLGRKKDDSDVVIIEDVPVTARERKKAQRKIDDSVIFVSENLQNCKVSAVPTYIPLDTPAEESYYKAVPSSTSTPKPKQKRSPRNDLFNSREQKQLNQYNENAYNPNKDDSTLPTKKRMVIVDGSNVAYHHSLNKEFSVKGLKICLDYFEKIGHEVKAVVPQFRLQRKCSSDSSGLEKLHQEGKIVFTPCKNLPGKSSTSYDDRFILQLASELDAAVVSNDNYRDLIHENPAFKKIIENRVIGYTWCNDLFILPKDPYGKWGPTLSTILNRS